MPMTEKFNWKIIVLPLAFLLIVAFVAWTIFDYGRYRAGFDRVEVSQRQTQYEQRITELETQVAEFRAQAVRLESAKKVDTYANQAVKDTLAEQESENQVLREELQFYRQIVSPGKGRQGMHIHDFNLSQGSNGQYQYRLMLIHIQGSKKHHRESDGDVRISIEGQQGGVNKKLRFAAISPEKKSRIRYRFKYFARFEGGLKLPKNFKPTSIEIQVVPRQKNIKGDTRKIKWPAAAG